MTKNMGKAKIVDVFLCLAFCWQICLSPVQESIYEVCGSEALPTVEEVLESLKLEGLDTQLHGTCCNGSKGTVGVDWSLIWILVNAVLGDTLNSNRHGSKQTDVNCSCLSRSLTKWLPDAPFNQCFSIIP